MKGKFADERKAAIKIIMQHGTVAFNCDVLDLCTTLTAECKRSHATSVMYTSVAYASSNNSVSYVHFKLVPVCLVY